MKKKALITGITGQDGAYLARLLLEKGYTVVGTSRDAQMAHFQGLDALGIRDRVRIESMALNDFRSVLQVLRKVVPDEIYNFGGVTFSPDSERLPDYTKEVNYNAVMKIMEVCFHNDIKFFQASSSEVFGNVKNMELNEQSAKFAHSLPS